MIDGCLSLQEENNANKSKVYFRKVNVCESIKWKRITACWKATFY